MIVLGIDPGLAATGWAALRKTKRAQLVDYGCIKTDKNDPFHQRLDDIHQQIKKLIAKQKPQALAIEEIFFAKNAKTALLVVQVMGVIKMTAHQAGLEVAGYTPLNIKSAITGYGRADKKQIEFMVVKTLGLKQNIKPDHAADAAAVALTHIFTNPQLV